MCLCTPACHLGRARVTPALRVPPGAEPVGRVVTLRGAVGVWPRCPGAVCGRTARRASVGEGGGLLVLGVLVHVRPGTAVAAGELGRGARR